MKTTLKLAAAGFVAMTGAAFAEPVDVMETIVVTAKIRNFDAEYLARAKAQPMYFARAAARADMRLAGLDYNVEIAGLAPDRADRTLVLASN